MGTLVISKKENNKYKYTYNNRKGHTLLTSQVHESKAHCISEINVLKRNFDSVEYMRCKTPSGKLYFKVSINGHFLGSSRKFTTPLLMEKGLNDFKTYFAVSEVLDFTENIFEPLSEVVFEEV